ncbi:MAG: hypothetical protein RLZZ272_43 [Actinomycetota bacterium]
MPTRSTSAPDGGIVLAGGASRRMGSAKAALEWEGRTLLDRVVGTLGRAVDGPVVVAAAPGGALPPLHSTPPQRWHRVDDPVADRGPLTGLATALVAHAAGSAPPELVFVSAVDLPLLSVELVRRILALLRAAPDVDVALPRIDGRAQPLAAAWRTRTTSDVLLRSQRGEGGFRDLLGSLRVMELDREALLADPVLRAVDPALDGFRDVDDPLALANLRADRPPR